MIEQQPTNFSTTLLTFASVIQMVEKCYKLEKVRLLEKTSVTFAIEEKFSLFSMTQVDNFVESITPSLQRRKKKFSRVHLTNFMKITLILFVINDYLKGLKSQIIN